MKTTKVFFVLGLAIIAAVTGALVWLASNLDHIVKSAIETHGPEITGVRITVKAVKISPTDGRGAITGLVVGNPKGFKTDQAFRVGEISVSVDPATLARDVVVIREALINSPDITYEKVGNTTNLDAIQHNVDNYVKAHFGESDKKAGTKMIIDDLYIRNGKITLSGGLLGGSTITTSLPDVHLKDVGRKTNGATSGEVAKQVMGAMMGGVTRAAGAAGQAIKKGAGSVKDTVKGWFK